MNNSSDADETQEPYPLTVQQILELPSSVNAETSFRAINISKQTGYRLVRMGELPFPVIRMGRMIRVPKAGILRALGMDQATVDAAERHQSATPDEG